MNGRFVRMCWRRESRAMAREKLKFGGYSFSTSLRNVLQLEFV